MTVLYVDADACPVKDEVYRVAARYGLQVHVVSNSWIRTPADPKISLTVVDAGPDVADDWIAERAGKGDIVITASGAITASGGSWNASIVAEFVKWKDHTVTADGVGSYIAEATDKGDFPRIVLGVAMMSLFVTILNRLFWRRLYAYAERRLRL